MCGRRGISRHVATVDQHCPHCGLDLERQVGSFIGGVGVNTVVAFACLLATIVIGFIATRGEPSVTRILLPALAVATIVPLGFYARSRLLWVAIELRWWPLEAGEVEQQKRFLRRYAQLYDIMKSSMEQYIQDVKDGDFPNDQESY